MPIRLNLLAEQQLAEEMKRRDPIKRAITIGVVLTVLMLLWIALTQMQVKAAKAELETYTNKVFQVEESARMVRTNQALLIESEHRIKSLTRYATNRFLWGTFLDALQELTTENIRLVEVKGTQVYITNAPIQLLTTNIYLQYIPPPAWWKLWATPVAQPLLSMATNEFKNITNKPPFTTNQIEMNIRVTLSSTNTVLNQVIAKAIFETVPFSQEHIIVTIKGRDYGQPPGAAIDEFASRIGASTYFQARLQKGGKGMRFVERPAQPQVDPNDPLTPDALYLPFTIECRFPERILTNE